MNEKTTRESVLTAAHAAVCGQREHDYGTPERNFEQIAKLWTVYTGVELTPVDVSMMMILLKAARIKSGGGTLDSFVDAAGYAACAGELWAGAADD